MRKIRLPDWPLLLWAQVFLTAVVALTVVYYLLGLVLIHEALDIQVAGKYTDTSLDCVSRNDDNTCAQYTQTTHYHIVTRDETFSASGSIYSQLREDQRYRVRVSGWKNMRNINCILAGPGL